MTTFRSRPTAGHRAGSTTRLGWLVVALTLALAACGTAPQDDEVPPRATPAQARALVVRLLPAAMPDRAGWATDIVAAFSALELAPTADNLCAVLAVTEQESTFSADPQVPGLAAIAWQEIDRQAERAGVPRLIVHGALRLDSPDGRSYAERIDAAKTERQLSEVFEDFVGMVPLGKRLLADRNPVRTGGPMQVSIAFAEEHAVAKTYPYPMAGGKSVRHEVFTRRGGLYFGIAHLLDYKAPYGQPLYRFADFNAGRYASRNAAFQQALSDLSGIPMVLDGDLLPPRPAPAAERAAGSTELAAGVLSRRLEMDRDAIRRDLERGTGPDFDRTRLHERVFALAEREKSAPLPRAVLPRITLQSPKITRRLTTEWFARRVDERHQRCLAKASQPAQTPSPSPPRPPQRPPQGGPA